MRYINLCFIIIIIIILLLFYGSCRCLDLGRIGGAVKLEFHDADTDTDTDIIARVLADASDTRDFLKLFLWQAERHADILATILARMSARISVSLSASWKSSLRQDGGVVKLHRRHLPLASSTPAPSSHTGQCNVTTQRAIEVHIKSHTVSEISSAEVSRCQRRFWEFQVSEAVRRGLRLTDKV